MLKTKKIYLITILSALGLIICLGLFVYFNSSSQSQIKNILNLNSIEQMKYAIKYDEETKTIQVNGDVVDQNGRGDYDYDNFVKSLPELFQKNLVHQFEYVKNSSVDKAGAIDLNLKIIPNTSFKFTNETFYSWKWNKNDSGICARNIRIIPQFAHIDSKNAKKIEKALNIAQCKLWNHPKNYKSLW